jgi:hypothetical protein
MDLIIASGYPQALPDGTEWSPMTPDFRATGMSSGGADEAATFDAMLKIVEGKKTGSISELGLVGHGSQRTFSLAGHKIPNNIQFDPKGMIHPVSIKDNIKRITKLRDRFAEDASITLFCCDSGSGDELLSAIADAFQVTVRGFQNEIWWCTMVAAGALVRGRTWYDSLGAGLHPRCGSDEFSADIRQWKPDKQKSP